MITFHEIYERYSKDVHRYSFWLSGNLQDAEDLTSETFARAWVGRHKIRTETVKAYLFAIARNLYLNQKRHADRKTELNFDLVDPKPGPDHLVEARLEIDRTMEAIQTLSEVDRTAFLLRIQHELPYAEIARILKISLTSAKVKVHRARLKLAEARLEKEE
jgi:RNA polymerase sigma-70 factor (ECF subfamily)